jgi:hypothetical protein
MANTDMKRRIAGGLLGGAALAALAFLVAGCGGSGSAATATTTTSSGTSSGANQGAGNRPAAFQAFTACLKQHGVATTAGFGFGRGPRPGSGGAGTGTQTSPTPPPTGQARRPRPNLTPAQQKAFQTCQSKLPNGGNFGRGGFRGGGNGAGGTQSNPAFARYTQCLKAHGVTFGSTTNRSTFQKAQQACAKYRPTGGGAAPGAGQPTTTTNGTG